MTPKFLKECSALLTDPLMRLFNCSLVTGEFPDLWKVASIVPIHKSGSLHAVENYRGISILNAISKVFEKIMHNTLYAASKHLISEYQHGFVKKRSTTSNLISFTTLVIEEMENRRQVDAIYIDFSKAFDKVPHARAIEKLSQMGFPAWTTNWLRSYLGNRKAFVRLGSTKSQTFSVASGVPQGSILGPLIFILFINDLCGNIKSSKLLYADDLKIFRTINSVVDCVALQADLNVLQSWCITNGMDVNAKNTKSISFTRRRTLQPFNYTLNSTQLERVKSIRDLGVIIDSMMRFDEHIAATTAKAFSVVGFIRRNTPSFDNIDALKALYCSLVRSILENAVSVWAPYHLVQTVRIERVQKSFLRYALFRTNSPDELNYADRCRKIGLEMLSARRIMLRRIFIYDLLNNNIDCPSLLQRLGLRVPVRQLRNLTPALLHIPFHRTAYGYNSPLDASIRQFNELDTRFDFNMSRDKFKKLMK